MRKYLIVFEKTKTGYSLYVPDLPGYLATGDSKEKAEQNIYQAIKFHLEGLKEENLYIPEPQAEAGMLYFDA